MTLSTSVTIQRKFNLGEPAWTWRAGPPLPFSDVLPVISAELEVPVVVGAIWRATFGVVILEYEREGLPLIAIYANRV
jgi:hypothetical protein